MAAERVEEVLRRQAMELFRVGLVAAHPGDAVRRALSVVDGRCAVLGLPIPEPVRTIRVVAFGKAACAMADAAERALPPSLFPGPGIAVTSYGSARPLSRFQVIEAGHPLPDANGQRGSRAIAAALGDAGADGAVLALVSGGGSALVPAPVPGISLEEKSDVTRRLLASGAGIGELNAVRKHLSTLKGGGMARIASPAEVRVLLLSDVLGDDPSVIASGPFAPDPTTFGDALRILVDRGVLGETSPAVRARLEAGARGEIAETPKPGDPVFARVKSAIIGSNRMSLAAVQARAQELGFAEEIFSDDLRGEAREAGRRLAAAARSALAGAAGQGGLAILAGGETTVTVKGRGKGGRNQELALAFALAFSGNGPPHPHAFLSAGTDGVDGVSDAAGGLVDSGTIARMRRRGVDPRAALDDNDSHRALSASGDLVLTGPTGTNVADLQILLVPPRSSGPFNFEPSASNLGGPPVDSAGEGP
jgi:glycerate 2-kinase